MGMAVNVIINDKSDLSSSSFASYPDIAPTSSLRKRKRSTTITNGNTTLVTSSTTLLYPPHPSCATPWIVSSIEIGGKIIIFDPLSGSLLPNIPHHVRLQRWTFNSHSLANNYHIIADAHHKTGNTDFPKSVSQHNKVLLFHFIKKHHPHQSLPTMVNNCYLLVLSTRGGRLLGSRPLMYPTDNQPPRTFNICYGSVDKFDDIIRFKGIIYALDRLGRLYKMRPRPATFGELEIIIDKPIALPKYGINIWRKRLVGSPSHELYLVVRNDLRDVLHIYTLYEHTSYSSWIQVETFLDDQVLFLSRLHGFFAPATEFQNCPPLRNCIFFCDAFKRRWNISESPSKRTNGDNEIQVSWLGGDTRDFKPISSYPGFPAFNFFSPPKWFMQAYKISCQSSVKSKSIIGCQKKVLIHSSVKLICPPKPSCGTPWIVSSVEIRGKTRLFNPVSGEALRIIPYHVSPTMWTFNPHYLAEHYHFAYYENDNDDNFPKSLFKQEKVLLLKVVGDHQDRSLPLIVDDCCLLSLTSRGQLVGTQPIIDETTDDNEVIRFGISYGCVDTFDDILLFKGIIYAVDRLGKLYHMSPDTFGELKMVIDKPVIKAYNAINIWRKRLIGSQWDEQLYMVVRNDLKDVLHVYELYEHTSKSSWIKVEAFENDQVLILCNVYGFFAPATEFPNCPPLKHCILFCNAFTPCSYVSESERPLKRLKKGDTEIQVFWLGGDDHQIFKPISSYPGFPAFNFFSPPKWFTHAHTYSCGSYYKSECNDKRADLGESSSDEDEDEGMQLDSSISMAFKASNSNTLTNFDKNDEEERRMCSLNEQIVGTSKLSYWNKNEEDSGPGFLEDKVYHANSKTMTLANLPACSTVTFEGVEIKSELLPTLQTIWDKQGSLIGEDTVRSKDMRSCALESVAKLVINLQNTTGWSLTDSEADEMRSILSDLRRVGLKVDWLAPTVEKASKLLSRKPILESVMLLNEKKAQVDKEEKELLAHTAKVKQEIEETVVCLSAGIPSSELIDLDDCLGRGLF